MFLDLTTFFHEEAGAEAGPSSSLVQVEVGVGVEVGVEVEVESFC